MPSNIVASELVRSSMRLIGAIASGETIQPEELEDGMFVLNDMLENWSTENMSVWGALDETFSLTPGDGTYTIGPGGNFNTVRPVRIQGAYVTYQGVDFPMEIINQAQYNNISLKTQGSDIPWRMLYVNDFPLGVITLWPVPAAGMNITLSADRVLQFPVTPNTVLTGPPGYLKALRFNLACEFAPEFGIEASPTVIQLASDAKADYQRANLVQPVANLDAALVGYGNASWQQGY